MKINNSVDNCNYSIRVVLKTLYHSYQFISDGAIGSQDPLLPPLRTPLT